MVFGIGLAAFGYAVFYWGVHHFPGWDCKTKDGCRYSLTELLGIPKSWGTLAGQGKTGKYAAVGLTAGPPAPPNQSGNNNANIGPNPGENTKTPNGLTGGNGWVNNILDGLSAPRSFNNQNKLTAWNNCEGNIQGMSGLGLNNPFNITPDNYQPATQGDLSDHIAQGGVHLSNFSTMTLGVQGNVAKINEPFARGIRNNLVNDGSFQDFANAVGGSGWGTSGSCISKSGS